MLEMLNSVEEMNYLESMVVNINALKDEVEHLEHKLIYANKIEQFLRTQILENELKIKA